MRFGGFTCVPGVTYHFPVTMRCWRGATNFYGLQSNGLGRLRRACDWQRADRRELRPAKNVNCPDCLAYMETLKRLGCRKFERLDPKRAYEIALIDEQMATRSRTLRARRGPYAQRVRKNSVM